MMYLTVKSLHIIAMVCWFAGLFYLPRIFVYAMERGAEGEPSDTLKIMAYKLLNYITTPAGIATWVLGITLLIMNPALFSYGWIHAKLTLVLILTGYHHSLMVFHRKYQQGTLKKSGKFFRLYNEIPTVILIVVVLLAVLKPF